MAWRAWPRCRTRLYAQERWALLVTLQAMDAAGKDGTIKHVMTGVNPQGVVVTPFKQPGPDALDHDFLWRVHSGSAPSAGASAFSTAAITRKFWSAACIPDLLEKQKLPDTVRGKKFWKHRLEDIAAFETYLARQGVAQVKILSAFVEG